MLKPYTLVDLSPLLTKTPSDRQPVCMTNAGSEPEGKLVLNRTFGSFERIRRSKVLDCIPRLLKRAFIETCDLGRNE